MAPQNHIWHFATSDAISVGAWFLVILVPFWQLRIWHPGYQLPLELLLVGVLYGNGTFGNKKDKISSHGKILIKVRRNASNRNDDN